MVAVVRSGSSVNRLLQFVAVAGWVTVFTSVGNGQEKDSADLAAAAKLWLEARRAEFDEYQLERDGEKPVELKIESRSLLNWSNAERGTQHGALFLWTLEGRPQMIACAFEWSGSLKHEFHSLSTESIAATRDGRAVHRFGPGVEWTKLEGAPAPAPRRALRLGQMRRQAARFRVSVGSREWAETRLLPQPVFRSPDSGPDDVAVFVFVQGTDPECMLMLETTAEGEWRYALSRQTKWGLKAELDGKQVWERKPNHQPNADPKTPFLVLPQTR
jgi:hypothetical protein